METKSPRAVNLLNRVQGGAELVKEAGLTPQPVTPVQPVTPPSSVNNAPKDEFDFAAGDYGLPEGAKKEAPAKQPEQPQQPAEAPKETKPEVVIDDPTGEDADDVEVAEDANHGKALKTLRDKYKLTKKERNELFANLEEARTKLKAYDDGTAVPEVMQGLRERVNQLETYEKLYNFEASPVYREKFTKPMRAEQEKLDSLAEAHGIELEKLNQAFDAPNEAERNKLLSSLFSDPLSAIEAKGIMQRMNQLKGEAQAARADVEGSLARMMEDADRIEAEARTKAVEGIKYNSKSAWSKALNLLREDKRFTDIHYQEGNTEHNEKVMRPIVTKSSQEFGRMLTGLMNHGLRELPEDLAVALANMNLLAHQSAAATIERDALRIRNAELEAKLQKTNRVNFPGVNRSPGVPTGDSRPKAVGATNAAKNVLNRVAPGSL